MSDQGKVMIIKKANIAKSYKGEKVAESQSHDWIYSGIRKFETLRTI